MDPIGWLFALTAHQLDVLRTIAIILGTGCVPVFGLILTWLGRAIRLSSQATEKQTKITEHVDGKQHSISVAELTKNVVHTTEEFRGELTHMAVEQARVHGRRRLPTTEQPQIKDSSYE